MDEEFFQNDEKNSEKNDNENTNMDDSETNENKDKIMMDNKEKNNDVIYPNGLTNFLYEKNEEYIMDITIIIMKLEMFVHEFEFIMSFPFTGFF